MGSDMIGLGSYVALEEPNWAITTEACSSKSDRTPQQTALANSSRDLPHRAESRKAIEPMMYRTDDPTSIRDGPKLRAPFAAIAQRGIWYQ